VKAAVHVLASDPRNTVILFSSREQSHLQLHWGRHNVVLVAECGASHREVGGKWTSLFQLDDEWIETVSKALKGLSFQFEETFIERKSHSIAWHYGFDDSTLTEADILHVLTALKGLATTEAFTICRDRYLIELVNASVDPGSFFVRWMSDRQFDHIFAVCGPRTSSTLFAALPGDASTVLVGRTLNRDGRVQLESHQDVVRLLQKLATMDTENDNSGMSFL
jgi:trehalose 6-phosphate synthase/phosphatase